MTILAVLISITVAIAVWFFRTGRPGVPATFNATVALLLVLGVVGATAYALIYDSHTIDRGWWPVAAVFDSAVWALLVILGAAVVRYFVLRAARLKASRTPS